MDNQLLFSAALEQWRALQGLGKKLRTQDYHRELIECIGREWPQALQRPVNSITFDDVVVFAQNISRFSVSRYNGIVSVLRAGWGIVTAARSWRRRTFSWLTSTVGEWPRGWRSNPRVEW